ncbi:MAG: hypothetical protein ACE5EK_06295 [Nitrospinales bacterium]
MPRTIYRKYGEQSWRFLDARGLYTIDCVREYFDVPMDCNTWYYGGKYQYRGFRPPQCKEGSWLSAHKRGMAFDLKPRKGNVKDMRLKIIENNLIFPYLTLIEAKVSWLHLAVENILDCDTSIKIIKP